MTPEAISTAVLAALTMAEKAGITELTKKVVSDAYDRFKSVLHVRFGGSSDPAQALARLEADSASKPRRDTFTEDLGRVNLADPEFVAAAQSLLVAVKALPQGETHSQTAIGHDIAQADRGGTASVTHYAPVRHD